MTFSILLFAISVIQTVAKVQDDNPGVHKVSRLNIIKLILIVILVFMGIDTLIKICECINWFRRRNLR